MSETSDFGYKGNFVKTLSEFICNLNYLVPCLVALINCLVTCVGVMLLLPDYNYAIFIILFWNIILILFFGIKTYRDIYALKRDSKKTAHGSLLRYRLIMLFTIVAVFPVLLLGLFSSIAFRNAAKGWFDTRVEKAVYNAANVAEAYLNEHHRNIRADLFATQADLLKIFPFNTQPEQILDQVKLQLLLRDLSSITLYEKNGSVLLHVRSNFKFRIPHKNIFLTPAQVMEINAKDVLIVVDKINHLLNAYKLVKLQESIYILHITRPVNNRAVAYTKQSRNALNEYQAIKRYRHHSEIGFGLIYISFGLFVIVLMVKAGQFFAFQLTYPLEVLTQTALKIESGDDTARCPTPRKIRDEIDRLSVAFNKMIDKISNEKKLTQAVLAGVSTGVICLREDLSVQLINQRALDIFKIDHSTIASLKDISNDFDNFSLGTAETDQVFNLMNGEKLHLHIRCSSHDEPIDLIRYIITVDDISDLMRIQSVAAWQDIAKRIAHEIKNPLTPISLAAERIERKWSKEITTSPQEFKNTIAMILKQVFHIKETANSLAKFAKTQTPIMHKIDIVSVVQDVITLERLRNKNIKITCDLVASPIYITGDERLLSQALINIMKNSAEAIEHNNHKNEGLIHLKGCVENKEFILDIYDNGSGLPTDIPQYKLFNPYVTNKDSGSGIGLAITANIITEHLGKIRLKNRICPETQNILGACVTINLPLEIEV